MNMKEFVQTTTVLALSVLSIGVMVIFLSEVEGEYVIGEELGTGSGSYYTDNIPIVENTETVYSDGNPLISSQYTINYETGAVEIL